MTQKPIDVFVFFFKIVSRFFPSSIVSFNCLWICVSQLKCTMRFLLFRSDYCLVRSASSYSLTIFSDVIPLWNKPTHKSMAFNSRKKAEKAEQSVNVSDSLLMLVDVFVAMFSVWIFGEKKTQKILSKNKLSLKIKSICLSCDKNIQIFRRLFATHQKKQKEQEKLFSFRLKTKGQILPTPSFLFTSNVLRFSSSSSLCIRCAYGDVFTKHCDLLEKLKNKNDKIKKNRRWKEAFSGLTTLTVGTPWFFININFWFW